MLVGSLDKSISSSHNFYIALVRQVNADHKRASRAGVGLNNQLQFALEFRAAPLVDHCTND